MSDKTLSVEEQLVGEVIQAIGQSDEAGLRAALAELHPAESANLVESIPDRDREYLWSFVPEEQAAEVMSILGEVARESLAEDLAPEALTNAAGAMELGDLVALVENLPDDLGDAIRESLDPEGRERLEATLAYPEGSAGRLMDTRAVAVRADVSLEVVLRYLRRREGLPGHTDALMVVDREGRYLGKLSLGVLLTRQPEEQVSAVMSPGADLLLGRITIDDVVGFLSFLGLATWLLL